MADTILDAISRHVTEGPIVHIDGWRGYSWLANSPEYSHFTVNHSIGFVNTENGVHTNGIEGTWAGMKRGMAPRNRTKRQLLPHRMKYIWRKKHGHALWAGSIYALSEVGYPEENQ